MSRRLATVAAALSLLLCAATVAVWVRSYRHCDVLTQPRGPADRWCITSEFGVFVTEHETARTPSPRAGWTYFLCPLPRRWPSHGRLGGFEAYEGSNRHYIYAGATPLVGIAVPYWFVFVLTSMLPIKWVLRRRQSRSRMRFGHCITCGYDLRASAGRCPECGTQVPEKQEAAVARLMRSWITAVARASDRPDLRAPPPVKKVRGPD